MDEISCAVFPDPDVDFLAGLEGVERAIAFRRLFERVTGFIRKGLSASPSRLAREGSPNVARLQADRSLVERVIGLAGVEEVNVFLASDGRAMRVPFLRDLHSGLVYPVMVVEFRVSAEWPSGSENFPFFRSLSGLFGQGLPLVFGYSCPFDPFEMRIEP